MLALSFRAGTARFALAAAAIVRVVQWRVLKPVHAAPPGVVGLLEHGGDLVPVIDLRLVLEGVPAQAATRLIVARVDEQPPRLLALLVEQAYDMLEIRHLRPRLELPRARFLGAFARDADDAQLIELGELLPAELRALARRMVAEPAR